MKEWLEFCMAIRHPFVVGALTPGLPCGEKAMPRHIMPSLFALLCSGMVACEPPKELSPDPAGHGDSVVSVPGCHGGEPILSISSHGGFFEHAMHPILLPYGFEGAWYVDGSCRVRSLSEKTRSFEGAELSVEQQKQAALLSTSPALEAYDGHIFGDQGCEGTQTKISTRAGTIYCRCNCEVQKPTMPNQVVKAIEQIEALRSETLSALSPLWVDLGLMVIDARSSHWSQSFDSRPDAQWQELDFPLDLHSLASLAPTGLTRVKDQSIKERLRTLLAQHLAWQAQQESPAGRRAHPGMMYLRTQAGQRFVVGLAELAEPYLVPNL